MEPDYAILLLVIIRSHVVRDLGTENGIDAFVSCGVIVEDFELGEL